MPTASAKPKRQDGRPTTPGCARSARPPTRSTIARLSARRPGVGLKADLNGSGCPLPRRAHSSVRCGQRSGCPQRPSCLSCAPSCARCATKRQPRGWRPRRRGRHSQCSLRPPASIRPTSRWPRCGTDGLRRLHTSTAGRAAMLRPINALGGYWFDGALRALEGLRHGLASTVSDPPPVTHHRVVFESGKLRLRHYAAAGKPHRTPILFVYALIKRPFILDIQKGRSVIEYLTRAGFDVFVT